MTAEHRIEDLVRDALRAHLRLARAISDDEPLLSSGLVDSLGVLEFVAAIEKATGVAIPVTAVTLENMDTVARVCGLVRRLSTERNCRNA